MRSLSRNFRLLLLAGGALLLALAGGYKLWRVLTAPKVPPLHLASAEPEIAAAVNAAAANVRETPRDSIAWGRLGAILFVHELYGDAAKVFAQAAKLDPAQPRWPYLRAISLADLNPNDAVPLLARASELTRDAAPAPRCRLAEFLAQRGRLDEAEKHFRIVLEHFPDDPRAMLGLGGIALQRDDLPAAIEWLEASAVGAPGVRETRALLATAHRRAGDNAKAELAARASSSLPSETAWPDPFISETGQFRLGREADLKKAQQLLDHGQLPELIAFMQMKVAQYGDDPRAWRLLGAAWLRQENYAGAERALRRAIALPPESADAFNQLGMALYHQDFYVEADGFFRRALRLEPADSVANFGRGLCLMEGRNWPAAIEAFQKSVRGKPDWVRPYLGLGDAFIKDGQADRAIAPLEQALKLDPENAQARELLDRARQAADGRD